MNKKAIQNTNLIVSTYHILLNNVAKSVYDISLTNQQKKSLKKECNDYYHSNKEIIDQYNYINIQTLSKISK